MRHILAITKALADSNRLRVLVALKSQQLCVCQLTELLQLAPSTVSKHLSILASAQLVESRKDGRWIHYYLPGAMAPLAVHQAIGWVHQSLADDAQVADDQKRLKDILSIMPEELCRK
jgi:ArsR family transcriptional regulator, arsenate/arsenite/antimonite-responsive transcriptional repressor